MEKESKQTEATMEQSSEELEATPQVTSPAEKAPSERPRTEEEFRKVQSMKDKADATLKSVQSELQELRKANEQQRLEARKKEITDLDGDPDGQTSARRKHQLEDELRDLGQQKEEAEGAVERKYAQAEELGIRYKLSLADTRDLMRAKNPEHMEDLAQLKAERAKGQGKVQSETEFKPDSATSDAAPSDFKQLEKNFIADPYKYGKAYKEALAKRGQ